MTMKTTTTDVSGILPEQVSALVVQPVLDASSASSVSTVVHISGNTYRIPRVTADPTAAWTAEGAEISASDATLDEIEVTPSKVAALSVITRELAEDSSPSAQAVVGDGLARDISRKVDAAYFGKTTTNGPSGIGNLTTSTATYANGGMADVDWALEAISLSEQEGGNLTAFVTDPATALAIAQLKEGSTSNRNLIDGRNVAGVRLLVNSSVTAGTIWGIDSRYSRLVVRAGTRLEVDRSVYFTSDQVAVKATMRVGFGFPNPLAFVKITKAAA